MKRKNKQGEEPALSKPEARVLLSIKKNITYISIANLRADWPDCDGNKQNWTETLKLLTEKKHILAFKCEYSGDGKCSRFEQAHDLNFRKDIVFKLSPTGESLLPRAKTLAQGEPKPTLIHNVQTGTWKVIR